MSQVNQNKGKSKTKIRNKSKGKNNSSNTRKITSRLNPRDIVFALDIGTHSVIGMLGKKQDTRMEVLEIYEKEYPVRAMLDGQIQDIEMVAKTAREVKEYLSKSCGVSLTDVFVAAAGRTLRTVESSSVTAFDEPVFLNDELITRINSSAIEKAEEKFIEMNLQDSTADEYYLSGYSISEYVLDGYPMPNIREHQGKVIEAKAIVTFLPRQVVESLYTAMTKIGLEVSGLTLEPIAAMNAAIPPNIRLLNLALVDVGAGTSDIAISRDGSVVGYTMVTIAGDEITETIMKKLLIDFDTAEEIKISMSTMGEKDSIKYNDILAIEHEISLEELNDCILESENELADEIAKGILSVNSSVPSAVFLVGGGSRLNHLNVIVAKALNMAPERVAMGGANFEKTAFSNKYDIKNPAYATVLGILLSAGFNMNNEGFFIKLNDKKCRLFRSGTITVFDVLMMNGYSHRDLFARKGDSLTVYIDGNKKTLFGEMSAPAVIMVNEKEAKATTVLNAGDHVTFIPAKQGEDAGYKLKDILKDFEFSNFEVEFTDKTYIAGSFIALDDKYITEEKGLNTKLGNNSKIRVAKIEHLEEFAEFYDINGSLHIESSENDTLYEGCKIICDYSEVIEDKRNDTEGLEKKEGDDFAKDSVYSVKSETSKTDSLRQEAESRNIIHQKKEERILTFYLNGKSITLPEKANGQPYILIDMLLHTGFDFDNPQKDIIIMVNGEEAGFSTILKDGDRIEISWNNR